jgi:uncharacterized RDD family membrane protein YckC
MDVNSSEIATLGIWTIARFAAIAVLATEALFLYARRGETRAARGFVWALTPAALLLGLCFWCSVSVSAGRSAPGHAPAVAQLGR